VPQEQIIEVLEFEDAEVGRQSRLLAFLAHDSDAHV